MQPPAAEDACCHCMLPFHQCKVKYWHAGLQVVDNIKEGSSLQSCTPQLVTPVPQADAPVITCWPARDQRRGGVFAVERSTSAGLQAECCPGFLCMFTELQAFA